MYMCQSLCAMYLPPFEKIKEEHSKDCGKTDSLQPLAELLGKFYF